MSPSDNLNLVRYLGSWSSVRGLIVFLVGIRLLIFGGLVLMAGLFNYVGLISGLIIVIGACGLMFVGIHLKGPNPHVLAEMVSWPVSVIALALLLWGIVTWFV